MSRWDNGQLADQNNIQHRTTNAQHPIHEMAAGDYIGCSMLDVGRSLFPVASIFHPVPSRSGGKIHFARPPAMG
jgi:hypothetical protein